MAGEQFPKRPVIASGDPGDQPVVIHHPSIALRARSVHENILNGQIGKVSSSCHPDREEHQATCPPAKVTGSV
jgi:hypothetical protein